MNAHDYTMSFARANVVGTLAGFAGAALAIGAFALVHGFEPLSVVATALDERFGRVLLVMLVSIVAHEALHGVGFRYFGGVPRSAIRYGVNWKTLTPCAGTSAVMAARGSRWSVALPGLVLGLVPVLWALVSGSGLWAAFGAFMIAGAGGDGAALWAMRGVPARVLVRDAEARVGCQLVVEDSLMTP